MTAESIAAEGSALEAPASSIRGSDLRLFYEPPGTLRMQVGEQRCCLVVKLYRVAPLSQPDGFVAFLDAKGYEICTLKGLAELDPDSRRIAEAELALRYLTARLERVVSITQESGISYWLADTDRGRRDFVVQGLQENCIWLGDDHIMLIDVDGNRFEVPSIAALDERSRVLLNQVL